MGRQYFNYIILGIAVLLFLVTLVKDWRPSFMKKDTAGSSTSKDESKPHSSVSSVPAEKKELVLPLQLQAYERLVVYLERIRIENMIKRLYRPDLNVRETEGLLIESIRSELDHNISQQIYVTTAAWEAVSSAKEQLIQYIHIATAGLSPGEDGNVLRKELLSRSFPQGESPVSIALNILNNEAKKLMVTARRS